MKGLFVADFYRLIRRKSLWVCLVLAALLSASLTFIGSLSLSMYDQTEVTAVLDQVRAGVPLENLEGDELVVGSITMGYGSFLSMVGLSVTMPFVAFFASLIVVLWLSEDFETGFVKNIFTARQGRAAYYGGKVLWILGLSLLFLVAAVLVTVAYRALIDAFYTSVEPLGEIILWFAFAWLAIAAYALICAVVFWLTRSKVLAILASALVSTGLLATIVFGSVSSLVDKGVIDAIQAWTLSGVNTTLTQSTGALFTGGLFPPALQVTLTLALWFAVTLTLTFTACRAKDVA